MISNSTPLNRLRSLFYDDAMEFRSTPKRTAIDASLLLSLIPEWERDAARRTSPVSARRYVQAVRPFRVWWERFGPVYDFALSPDALLDFQFWLRNDFVNRRGKPPTQNGQANCLNRMRMLFRWASVTGRADMDISAWVPTVAFVPRRSRLWDIESLRLLLIGAEGGKNPIRDKAIIGMIAGTGARSVEVYNAEIGPQHMRMNADKSGSIHLERTKGNKPRITVFGPTTGRLIENWIEHSGRETGYFCKPEFSQEKVLYEVVSRCAHRAGLGTIGPHDIRKFFCSYWYRQYAPDDRRADYFLRLQIGHADKSITEKHYLNMTTDDLLQFYVSPLEDPAVSSFF